MDFKTQTNSQQTPQPQPAAPVSRVTQSTSNSNGSAGGGRRLFALITGLVVLLALVVGGLLLWQSKDGAGGASAVEKDGYQAIFMTNGQVYFGHLSNLGADYTELTDVYYLQVQQSVPNPSETTQADLNKDQPNVSLTKLGNELHGPKDKMHISKDQILFWENLKDDSTVVKAIKDYQAKQ